jgi:leucyl aminopeptidase
VRDWVNNPPGDFTPKTFADTVVATNKMRSGARVTVRVYDEKALADEGFGGILGVGQGSDNPPRLVRLSYKPAGAKAHLGLVGKGITYDSGGLSIKPAASMQTMKMDMAGAAAVVAATLTIADLGLPIQVTTYAPMAENMISGDATRPGDVLTMYGGRTVEVLNTDAEGRLILADALVKANESKPDVLIDVATLTGACVMALGDRVSGLMGNDDDLVAQVRGAAGAAGEYVWPLPIPDEMGEKVRGNSKIADLAQHNTDRWGGALFAAAFLREFVGDTRWAHLDIAGPAYNEKGAYGYTPVGGTGVMVATLVQLATELAG